ncbi:efflux RND transporter permease subunit [Bradyrhizobium sp. AUGA SZCCT0283]|uniref:efflux RND transporter permease subunit n=1 Tax=Bradyrhizobium sp. AUGA SZCCT0283 TaxID=2807671 RepID=UPI001BA8F5F1|nr:efflux RND transporter permease subunit [Bradyrhizobium sp. AUGA SZCCT0283]MBR1278618.1 efflux RND transporter permease subunit [Bradyrhizobium sp. AUGA SZCCT0283]
MSLGLSGRLTKATIRSPLTPLFLLAALAAGLVALITIPREEEPQISVPMVDITVRADGLKAPDAVELVTKPLETVVKAIDGVEHTYSQTQDDRVMVTARFLVGTKADEAILRVHEKIRANIDRIPVGIPEPLIVGRGINDVAIMVVTLSPKPVAAERYSEKDLYELAEKLRSELNKVDNVGLTYIAGGDAQQIRVEPDPEKLSLYGVTLQQLLAKVRDANRSFQAGRVRDAGQTRNVAAGQTLSGVPDIGLLLVTTRDNRPVYVRDVAKVVLGPSPAEHRVWNVSEHEKGTWTTAPAISVAIAKRAGANAVVVAHELRTRIAALEGRLIPADVAAIVTRDYGETANEKANELLFHLGLATVSIVVLIAFAIGWREAVVTLVVIPTTILLTLFAANLMGYTINRVSLFALIFSIGILVDDAIVVVENIARHWAMRDGRPRLQAAIEAVAEVGNPTILATLTVVAALLPMLFVSGLMGPYMAPIPANASAAMLFSFFVAMVIAPWLMLKLHREGDAPQHEAAHGEGWLGRLYRKVAAPVIRTRRSSWTFLISVGVATLLVMGLFYTRSVTVKLLPFDNKSEIAVVADLPEGASLEDTERVLLAASDIARQLPEVTSVQVYAGTAAPFNFNGLVRHYYLRAAPELGELQVNLTARGDRSRASHVIALELREKLKSLVAPEGTSIKVVEVPPGPPVMATLLAEIYGPDSATRRAVMNETKKIFASVPFIVDVDDSVGQPRPRLRLSIDQDRLEFFGVEQKDVYDTIEMLFGGLTVGYSHRGEERNPIAITVRLPKSDLSWTQALASTPVPANVLPGSKTVVELGEVVRASTEAGSPVIFRRDGRFADMVMAELAGSYEAPIYGMLEVARRIDAHQWGNLPKPAVGLHGQPADETKPTLLWDGEWEITYVTFRDMGAAFAIAIVGIYILVVAQFGSFKLPLVILTPIPLTLIGILVGHWLFAAPFTATSMIGFIALAGIIVRNSILLVDFIRHGAGGSSLRERLLEAGAVRFKPIILTALAAMIGAATILPDPIFQGLAISLLFGLASSTLLTVLVIPAIYIALRDDQVPSQQTNG